MPRNVRNFWIEAKVDGRKTPIAFGPQGKDGGFELTVHMRNKGEVERVLTMSGWVASNGMLCLSARTGDLALIANIERKR